MNPVSLIDPLIDPRWDRFVSDHPFGWVCHLSSWKHVLEGSFKHMKGYYFALMDDSGEHIQAACPAYHVSSWLTGDRMVSIPFANICDPLILKTEDFTPLLEAVKDISEKKHCSYVEFRTYLSTHLIQSDGLLKSEQYTNHVLSLERPLAEIKGSFKSIIRNDINRGQKSGIDLITGNKESDMMAFYRLYFRTRKELQLPCQPYMFFKSIYDHIITKNLGCVLLGKKEGEVIVGAIFLSFKERLAYEYAAWNRKYKEFRPNYFIIWEAIKLAHSSGYKIFDFGRTHNLNKGLMYFKERWNTTTINMSQIYHTDKKIENLIETENSVRYKTVRMLCRILPDYPYTQMGNFLYKHRG